MIRVGVVPLALFLVASAAFGIASEPPKKLCASFFEADEVYLGEILEDGYFPPGGDDLEDNYQKYKVKVLQVFRGNPEAIEFVLSQHDSGGWRPVAGRAHVVFSRKGMAGSNGPLDGAEFARRAAAEIAALPRTGPATVEGEVVRYTENQGPKSVGAGTEVRLFGMESRWTTKTDANGQFSFSVPAGLYYVQVPNGRSSDYSRRADEAFQVVPGQCAQFQFLLGSTADSASVSPAAKTRAEPEAPQVPSSVVQVVEGGAWNRGDEWIPFRVVVERLGFEHVSSRVWLEWLSEPRHDRPAALVRRELVRELSTGFWSVTVGATQPDPAGVRFRISATNPYSLESAEFLLVPAEPGEYELVRKDR